MSREREFRVFCEKHNRWEYYTLGGLICGDATSYNFEGGLFRSETWGEYIGIKAKNKAGEEIKVYEGDIVSFRANFCTLERCGDKIGEVVYEYDSYKLKVGNELYSISEETDEFEAYARVLGTIHFNRVLLNPEVKNEV